MKISKVRLKNFRSIKEEASIDFCDLLFVVGPNNSGKTNLLKAIQFFFESHRENNYSTRNDLSFGVEGELTSIILSFVKSNAPWEEEFLCKYNDLIQFLDEDKEYSQINLYLTFSQTGRPSYRFITNDKIKDGKRDDFRRFQEELVGDFLDRFVCKYIPSEKAAGFLFTSFLTPHLKTYVGNILQGYEVQVTDALDNVSNIIGSSLRDAGFSDIKCEFSLPDNLFSNALSHFDIFIDDGEKTHFDKKGSGIQAAVTLACFNWIDEQERLKGRSVLWLIEEPESYLHPALTESCSKIINNLSKFSPVFSTTHSIGFIPSDHKKVLQTTYSKESGTEFKLFENYLDATRTIREALGVRFSDYYNLSDYNVFVEGKTDKMLIEHVLSVVLPNGRANHFEFLRKADIKDFTGTSSLKDFLKSTYALMSKERAIVIVLDGDDAGKRIVKELNGYFGQKKIKFDSNQEYILLPDNYPIEGLFPFEWLQELHEQNPSWVRFDKDVFDKVVNLQLESKKKTEIASWLINRSIVETSNNNTTTKWRWANNFIKVFEKLDEILKEKHNKINS